jgi:hypothetical protein
MRFSVPFRVTSLHGYTAKILGLLFVSIALGYCGCAVA